MSQRLLVMRLTAPTVMRRWHCRRVGTGEREKKIARLKEGAHHDATEQGGS